MSFALGEQRMAEIEPVESFLAEITQFTQEKNGNARGEMEAGSNIPKPM
jgi:hypothetical protein